jgi:hypothetical protein
MLNTAVKLRPYERLVKLFTSTEGLPKVALSPHPPIRYNKHHGYGAITSTSGEASTASTPAAQAALASFKPP